MSKLIRGCIALSCALLFAPTAPAMQRTTSQARQKIEKKTNIKANIQQESIFPLDYENLERVRIELLERGFDPGFAPDRGEEMDPQFAEALAQFQMEYGLSATGEIDTRTLAALSVPTEKTSPTMGQSVQRAKPSK